MQKLRLRLTIDETKRIADLINAKGALDPACEFCGAREFMVGEFLVHPWVIGMTEDNSYAPPIEGPVHPMALCSCRRCGNTKFFNTLILGFRPDPAKEKSPAPGDGEKSGG